MAVCWWIDRAKLERCRLKEQDLHTSVIEGQRIIDTLTEQMEQSNQKSSIRLPTKP
jgi:hypothetical protein